MLVSAEIIAIHEMLIGAFGGMRGITEAGFARLDGAAAMPEASAFGEALFPTPIAQAAALCYAIIRSHPFSDGNKRVGLVALDVALARHGITLRASNDSAYETIMAVADGRMTRDELIIWVEANSDPA